MPLVNGIDLDEYSSVLEQLAGQYVAYSFNRLDYTDLYQEGWLALRQAALDRPKKTREFRAWAYVCVRNHLRGKISDSCRERTFSAVGAATIRAVDERRALDESLSAPQADITAERQYRYKIMRRRLPRHLRFVLEGRFLRGRTISDLAWRTGVGTSTVHAWLKQCGPGSNIIPK